ncbi:hypothetical protein HZH66_013667 [Vespula vulgaris]|uniref:Uncharacterized protein n=1 Tax=Vespula vulgaris TaxID=7454 RepID=A0A834MRU1_VESVU|nr:hypothetical protein HZH66_013667 [Vespula vulgaris]
MEGMEMTTMVFKWRRAFSREGIATTNFYFSQLYESLYYVKRIVQPYYIVVISNYNAINEFSLATRTFDMSSAIWLVIFNNKEYSFDYCHNPPGNIFHLKFNSEMLIRCGTENILREWYSVDTRRVEINDVATWSLEKGITKIVPDSLYERRHNLQDFSDKSSLRIAYFSIFFFITVISAAYSAALISFLTSIIHILPFHSLESFVEDGTYQFAVFRGTAYYDKFANSVDPLAKKVMKLMLKEEKLPSTILEAFNIPTPSKVSHLLIEYISPSTWFKNIKYNAKFRLHFWLQIGICKNRNLAIYTFDEIRRSVDLEIPCNVVRVEAGRVNRFAIVLSKHNPFTGVINFQLQKFVNNGMINRLRDTIFKKKFHDMIKYQPVPITTVISLIFFIQIGIILGRIWAMKDPDKRMPTMDSTMDSIHCSINCEHYIECPGNS